MIVFQPSHSRIVRLLPAALLACTVCLLPARTLHAQSPDYEAVGARLLRAVGAGELSPSQATAMMGALAGNHFAERMKAAFHKAHAPLAKGKDKAKKKDKKKDKAKKKTDKDKKSRSKAASREAMIKDYMTKVKQQIDTLVKAGRLSKTDARKRYDDALKAIKRKVAAGLAQPKKSSAKTEFSEEKAKAWLTQLKRDLKAMVKSGKISEADANRKYAAAVEGIKKKMAAGQVRAKKSPNRADAQKARIEQYLLKVKKSIAADVKAGKISEADAKKRYESAARNIKRRMAAGQSRARQAAPKAADPQVRRRVAAAVPGQKRTEVRRRTAAGVPAPKARAGQAKMDSYKALERAIQDLRKAVDAGLIQPEQARRKLAEIRKRMQDTARLRSEENKASEDRKRRLEAYRKRLTAAVESGRLTREDAKRRMETFIKNMMRARQAEGDRPDPAGRRRQSI